MKKNKANTFFVFKFTTTFFSAVFFSFFGIGLLFLPHYAFAATPTVVGAGTSVSSLSAVTPPLPTGLQTNDILLLFVETANQAITIPTPNGGVWTAVTLSPQGTGTAGAAGATRLTVFWSRYNGTQGAPTTSDSGDHQFAQIIAYRGVTTTGNPWDITADSVLAPSSSAVTLPGVTTTVTDTLIVLAVANDTDVNNTAQTSGWANGNLTGVAEIVNADRNTNTGSGGGFGVATGGKATVGGTGNTTATLLTPSVQAMMTIALKPPLTLLIGSTAGTQVANLNSGDTLKHANDVACSSPASCSAFTLFPSSGETLTSIKITETGTTNATNNLSNFALFYDTDGDFSNGVVGQYGSTVASLTGEAATVSGSLALVAGTTYYFYVRYDLINGANDPMGGETIGFQIALSSDVVTSVSSAKSGAPASLSGNTTIRPNATGVTYQVGDGGRSGYSATISGFGFGVALALSRSNCEGGASTGCIQFVVGGNSKVLDADVTSWANRTIAFTISDALASYGGVNSIQVTASSQSDTTPITFYIYPDINQIDTPLIINGAREGENITLTNSVVTRSRFGATQGTVDFVGGFGSVPATIVSWSDTSIVVTVPAAISDSAYLGDIKITRASDSKTELAYDGLNVFQILPSISITLYSPTSGLPGTRVKIAGDHFCQGGVCPVSSSASNKVVFGTTQALDSDFVSNGVSPCNGNLQAWTDTEICINVPASTPTGLQKIEVTSEGFASNKVDFTVLSSAPSDPVNLIQKDANSVTITTGGTASSTPVRYTLDTSSAITGGTMYAQVEVRPVLGVNKDFTSTCSANSYCFEGTGTAYTGGTINLLVTSTPTDDIYHWQARVRYNKSGTDYYSSWISFDSASPETSTDFRIDTTAPLVTSISSGIPGSNSATITWDTLGEVSTSRVEYDIGGTFSNLYNCSGTTECTALTDVSPRVYPHSVSLSNLNSGTTYSYRVRSMDAAGNETVSGINTFLTATVNNPAKTTKSYIDGALGQVPGTATYYFTVNAPELSPLVKNAYVEVVGIASGGTGTVGIKANGGATRTFDVVAGSPTLYRLVYQITNPNLESNLNLEDAGACSNGSTAGAHPCNKLIITPTTVGLYVLSAKIVATYSYTP